MARVETGDLAKRWQDVRPLFDQAMALFQGGRLAEAQGVVRSLLADEPKHAEALHLMGVLLSQQGDHTESLRVINAALQIKGESAFIYNSRGIVLVALKRFDEALADFERAIALNPQYAVALGNRGNTCQELGRFEDAIASYDKAIALDPDDAEAFCHRGRALQELKRFDEAVASYEKAIALRCDYAEAFSNHGTALQALGRHAEAVTSYERAIALKPDFHEAICSRGCAFQELKRFNDALTSYDRAIALKPGFAEAFNSRAAVLRELHRLDEALVSCNRSIALKPDFADAFNNRGIILGELQHLNDALVNYNRAISLKTDYPEAFYNRGNALRELKRFDEALANYDKAIALKPEFVEVFSNRGVVLQQLKRFDEALASYDKAIALNAEFAEAFYNRGAVLQELNRLEEALASYEQTLVLKLDHGYALSGVADCALRLCDWSRTTKLSDELKAHVAESTSIVRPFNLLGYNDDSALQLKCAQSCIKDHISTYPRPLWSGEAFYHDHIRIAYLSADYRRHPTAYLIAELFELHNRSRFEVLGISFGADDKSDMRSRLMKAFDQFHDVRFKSDRDAAKLMYELRVDIAVDLMGHTKDARPGILANRPAPIQVNYLGYPGTMGADFIDYVIADKIVLPFEQQPYYVEKIVYLPECYQANDSKKKIAADIPTRQQVGLPASGFVFCCFNNSYKVTTPIFEVWMRLLHATDASVLWLLQDNEGAEKNLRHEAAARGIDPARLVFAVRVPLEEHLARQRLADLFLDTIPYNAHTTASDALWAGLPVLTCCGKSFTGRVAASLLTAVGLSELITHSLADYEALALRLARDRSLLASIKTKLIRNRENYPLFDSKRFTRHLEAAYTMMWEIWQRGESPRSFDVAPEPHGRILGSGEQGGGGDKVN